MAASEQWYPRSSAASMASTPGTADSLGDLVSPSKLNLPTRKRSHSTHLNGQLAPVDNKSRRTSLSPFGTGPPTPSTSSSRYVYSVSGAGYYDLTLFAQLFETPRLGTLGHHFGHACIG